MKTTCQVRQDKHGQFVVLHPVFGQVYKTTNLNQLSDYIDLTGRRYQLKLPSGMILR